QSPLPKQQFNTVNPHRITNQTSSQHSQPQSQSQPQPQSQTQRPVSQTSQQQQISSNDPNQQQQQQQQQFHRKAIGDWEFTKTIGAGSMGKVKLARHRITNEICAIKVVTRAAKVWQRQHINDPPTSDPHELSQRKKEYEKEVARDKRTIREAALGKILYHPFICRLYEMYAMSNHYYMLFEYVSGGQMLDYIVAHGSLKESQARKFCRGIGSALDYCHSNNIVHRDLKIENIMINNSGEIKIIDFGLSNLYSNDHLLKTYCGSLYFAAPELLSAHPYRGPEVDIWSFGVVLFVLVCGRVPFDDKSVSNLHEKIKKGHIDYPDHLSIECVDLLKRMLVVDVNKRANIYEVLSHKWMIKGYNNIVSNYIPFRTPIQLPLNFEIVKEIVNLNLANNEEQVINDLTEILNSNYYIKCVNNWILKNSNSPEQYDPSFLDPTKGFHPLISIYHLVHEMIDRKKLKNNNLITNIQNQNQVQFDSNNINLNTTPQLQQNPIFNVTSTHPNMAHESNNRIVTQPIPQKYQHKRYNSQQLPSKSTEISQLQPVQPLPHQSSSQQQQQEPQQTNPIQVPNAAFNLPFPQAAHTSPHTEVSPHSFNSQVKPLMDQISMIQQQSTPPPQQQSPLEENGVNSILRKLSTKKQRPEEIQKEKSKDDIRRIGSVKVTSKEKQQTLSSNQIPPLSNNSRRKLPQHQRAISAYTASTFNNENSISNPTPNLIQTINSQPIRHELSSNSTRKYHPSARANSVGHSRKHSLNINKNGTYTVDQNAPPLPQFDQNRVDYDGFFDDEMDSITFCDESEKPKKKLTEKQIIEEYEKAPPNSMPSIEFPKTLFLKGFFSVQTTSTKPLPIIRYDIITVLPQLGVHFVEVKGGFICVHYPSIVDTPKKRISSNISSPLRSPSKSIHTTINETFDDNKYIDTVDVLKTPNISENSSQMSKSRTSDINNTPDVSDRSSTNNATILSTPSKNTHRRKFSLGNGLLGSKKGEKLTVSTNMLPTTDYNIPTTPAPANITSRSLDDSSESLTLDETNGASDMLVSSRVEQQNLGNRSPSITSGGFSAVDSEQRNKEKSSKTPLKFEIHIVKVPLVGLYGIQFKKVSGNTWLYKSLASEILNRLNL
ncbi:serine/threonine-protein kinase KIN2, partial [Pichia californica]